MWTCNHLKCNGKLSLIHQSNSIGESYCDKCPHISYNHLSDLEVFENIKLNCHLEEEHYKRIEINSKKKQASEDAQLIEYACRAIQKKKLNAAIRNENIKISKIHDLNDKIKYFARCQRILVGENDEKSEIILEELINSDLSRNALIVIESKLLKTVMSIRENDSSRNHVIHGLVVRLEVKIKMVIDSHYQSIKDVEQKNMLTKRKESQTYKKRLKKKFKNLCK